LFASSQSTLKLQPKKDIGIGRDLRPRVLLAIVSGLTKALMMHLSRHKCRGITEDILDVRLGVTAVEMIID